MPTGGPRLVLDEDVMRFMIALSPAVRRRLVTLLEQLREHASDPEDFREQDATGRWLNVKAIRPFLITYWLDSPVDELRIVDIQRIR